MPDTPDRAAREAAAKVLRDQIERDRALIAARVRALTSGRPPKSEFSAAVDRQNALEAQVRATRLEQVAAWLEGQDG